MKAYVAVKSFSGDKQISCRELSVEEYYDGDVAEIDDSNYILANKIDRVEMILCAEAENVTWINYYKNGSPYRFDEIRDGVCTTTMV